MTKTGVKCNKCGEITDQSPCWNCGNPNLYVEMTKKQKEKLLKRLNGKDLKWERDSALYQKAGKSVPRLIIEIESGCVYGVIADKPVKITILDRDAGGKGRWDAEIDEDYVKDNFSDEGGKEAINY